MPEYPSGHAEASEECLVSTEPGRDDVGIHVRRFRVYVVAVELFKNLLSYHREEVSLFHHSASHDYHVR